MFMSSKQSVQKLLFFLSNVLLLLSFCFASHSRDAANLSLPSDAKALLAFKSKADLKNTLLFSQNTTLHFCRWKGVICYQHKVVRLVLENLDLGGFFPPDSLSKLDQLRVLSLKNDSLTGPIPDLSRLVSLKSLFLNNNFFTGSFPSSILFLHRLKTLDLSSNNLTGQIPKGLTSLDRLYSLRLDLNRLNGSIPPMNQSSLITFNVSGNNLTGAIPVTPALSRFDISSFLFNPGLCGEIIHKECHPSPPFFGPSTPVTAAPPPAIVLGQSAQVRGVELTQPSPKKQKRTVVIISFSSGVFVLIASLLCLVMAVKKQNRRNPSKSTAPLMTSDDAAATAQAAAVIQTEQENELEEKVKRVQGMQMAKSGNLVFCAGEAHLYTLDQLMRASAELLGRGTMGTTYKAILDSRLIVCVKRLDGSKLASTSKELYQQHMESVGGLRHPNLVPLRAYFQAKEERLLIYDYQPNGSLFSLIHGSRSTRAKPLHWTSCLKIAEDVAQGLSYIHQAWRLVHGNLKSSNVLLGPDFEACLADYCLAALSNSPPEDDPANLAYKAPESRNATHQATAKSDVYAFGVLLVELSTGKPPSQHPYLLPDDMMKWVRTQREDDSGDDDRLGMLMEVATGCMSASPEQRPTMWQVLKMLQEIKEAVLMDDGELHPHTGMS